MRTLLKHTGLICLVILVLLFTIGVAPAEHNNNTTVFPENSTTIHNGTIVPHNNHNASNTHNHKLDGNKTIIIIEDDDGGSDPVTIYNNTVQHESKATMAAASIQKPQHMMINYPDYGVELLIPDKNGYFNFTAAMNFEKPIPLDFDNDYVLNDGTVEHINLADKLLELSVVFAAGWIIRHLHLKRKQKKE